MDVEIAGPPIIDNIPMVSGDFDGVAPSIPIKSFAPKGEQEYQNNSTNINHWVGYLGSNYSLKLATWKKNNEMYLQIRRNQNVGANLPIELYWSLKEAMVHLEKEQGHILPKPNLQNKTNTD